VTPPRSGSPVTECSVSPLKIPVGQQKPLHSANCLWIHTLQNVPEGGGWRREFTHSEPLGIVQFPASLMKVQNVFIMWGVQIDKCLYEVIGYFLNTQLWLYRGETP
jgi:hypothetical protein